MCALLDDMGLASESHGAGFPVVCLPWFSLDASTMAAALEPALAGHPGLRRIYVDLPGCGRSPGGPANSDGVVAAVAEFIDQEVGSGRFLLAGCSYGGYVSAALARRRPDRVAGLLLICHGVKIGQEDRDLPPAPVTSEAALWLGDVPPDLRPHLSVALGNHSRTVAARVGAVLAASGPGDEAYLRRLRESGYRLSDEDSTAVYDGPTSIIVGRRDYIIGYADQFRALATYPRGSYAVLDGAGHYLPFEQPEAFRGLVRDWLTRST